MKKTFSEDAPTNSTGPQVVGTSGDPSEVFKKKKKKKILKRLKATYEVGRKPDKELVLKKEEKGSPADKQNKSDESYYKADE